MQRGGGSFPHVCPPLPILLTMHVQGGWTPLIIAAENGNLEVVQALLAAGARKDATLTVSGTPAAGHVCVLLVNVGAWGG